jgi:hypothetical protein
MSKIERVKELDQKSAVVSHVLVDTLKMIVDESGINIHEEQDDFSAMGFFRHSIYSWGQDGRMDSFLLLNDLLVIKGGYDEKGSYLEEIDISSPSFSTEIYSHIENLMLNGLCYSEDSR